MTGKIWFSVFILIATAWQAVSSDHINDSCTDDYQCLSDIKFSICLEGHCICSRTSEFIDSNNVTRCKGPPDASCSNDTNFKCVDHASCHNNVCTCDNGYTEDFFLPNIFSLKLDICAKNISVGIGKECEGKKQCTRSTPYSFCNIDHKCECNPSTTPKKIPGKWVCTISVFPDQHCDETEICDAKHASCKNQICTCDKGYKTNYFGECSLKSPPKDDSKDDSKNDSLSTLTIVLISLGCFKIVSLAIYIACKYNMRASKYRNFK